jgi:hypothetical protein
MSTELAQLIPTLKVRDIPQDLVMSVEVGNYKVKISTRDETNIVIEYVGDGRWGLVRLVNPDPEIKVIDIVEEAQALIEKFIKKSRAQA